MNVTICELRDDPEGLAVDWRALTDHTHANASQLVLLPEMPFSFWMCHNNQPNAAEWQAAVEAHDRWIERLPELGAPVVCATRPVTINGRRFNEAFIWDIESGYRAVHHKTYLPDEPDFYEATWYNRGPVSFIPTGTRFGKIGFLVCTEIWFTEHARAYARQGVCLVLCPRTTEIASADKWVMGGRVAAIMAGAFCLSANRSGSRPGGITWGGSGWIAEPSQGELLGRTSTGEPYVTVDIDLAQADAAKYTYPRYVME
jgi:N-carbamoylputrescine amidase